MGVLGALARAGRGAGRRLEGVRGLGPAGGGVLSAACLAGLLACTDLKTEGTALYADPGWDRHLYRLMAEQGLFEFRLAPYCWRVLMPALAGWSPWNLQTSFFAITLLTLWGTGTVLYWTLRGRSHQAATALLGVLLFYSLGWGPKFILADFWIPDGVAMVCVALALWAALERRLVLFGAVLFAGVLAKESVLIAAPLYLCLNFERPVDRRWVASAFAALLPAALALIALRVGVAQENGDADYLATLPEQIRRFPELYGHYDYWTLFNDITVDQRLKERSLETLSKYTTSPLGLALPLLTVIGLRRSWRMALGMLPSIALTYAQLLFATDTQRLIVLVSPLLVMLAMEGARQLKEAGISELLMLLAGLFVFSLALLGRQTYDVAFSSQALVVAVAGTGLLLQWRFTRGKALATLRS